MSKNETDWPSAKEIYMGRGHGPLCAEQIASGKESLCDGFEACSEKEAFIAGLRTAYLREFERVDEALWKYTQRWSRDADGGFWAFSARVPPMFGDEAVRLDAEWHRLRVLAETAE